MNKRLVSILLVVCLILILPIQALSVQPENEPMVYLNLGDSIAYGMSAAPGSSYYDFYAEYLYDDYGVSAIPNSLSRLGITSGELLGALTVPGDIYGVQTAVGQADVITISIGGNNLLRPVIAALCTSYGVAAMEELPAAIYAGGESVWSATINYLIAQAQDSMTPLGYLLLEGSQNFIDQWPQILEAIYFINPDADVITLTIYNPVEEFENPVFFDLIEELIEPMNQALRQNQGRESALVNVYNAFRKDSEAVNFSLSWMPELDFHPTQTGHDLIFEELLKVRNPMTFK